MKITIDRSTVEQALEALERNTSQDMSVVQGNALARHALRAALAEPVREPVGVVTSMVKGGVTWHRWPGDMPDGTTLYTAPPQRPAEPTV
jgi:hypothetical protein